MKKHLLLFVVFVLILTGVSWVLAQDTDADIEAKIEDAMSAAPLSIGEDATILDWAFGADGHFVVLREGTRMTETMQLPAGLIDIHNHARLLKIELLTLMM